MTAIPWLLAAIFAVGCVYLWLVVDEAADEAEKRERGMRERLRQLELQVAYYRAQAARQRVEQMAWPEQVRNVWMRAFPN